ncbi:hypothetical protein FA95DRAFT_1572978 [Auriscalpium vulgare]|uniref:Uncharacterized protein n=1 Tax=Auriscalpium vulgare TaxID=40419 RepID=A0ACB8RRQ0_9AGAM|nr:hypothetical protein FA95DRAFT_1572978 [Auriscalpium vulgare]
MAEANHEQTAFQWKGEYSATLEGLASTDTVECDMFNPSTEWALLRDIIKHRINENIASFLADSNRLQNAYIPPFSPRPSTPGGLRIAPFTFRARNEANRNEAPKSFYSEQEAREVKESLFAQLDTFDGPPFTIQRVAELLVRPKESYRSVGKYLRALERGLYVTSPWDSFPPLPPQPTQPLISSTALAFTPTSVPSTPLFSPIPFLHEDARRSKSRSPPPSPLALAALDSGGAGPLDLQLEPRGLGMVDEMDDPRPGHLSERPTALTAVTSVGEGSGAISLEERFVRASGESDGDGAGVDASPGGNGEPGAKRLKPDESVNDGMVLDEHEGDKENKS